MLRVALLCLVSLSAYHTYGKVDDAVNARYYEYIAGDNESNVLSAPESQEGASQSTRAIRMSMTSPETCVHTIIACGALAPQFFI